MRIGKTNAFRSIILREKIENLPIRMKSKILFIISFQLIIAFQGFSQPLRKINNGAFQRGEQLYYRAFYEALLIGQVDAGEAKLEVKMENSKIANRSTYKVVFAGETKDSYNWFYRVSDRYETVIDEEAMVPWIFVRRMEEGKYRCSQNVVFNQIKKTAQINDNNPIKIQANVQDFISILYYARTIDVSGLKVGAEIPIDYFLDDNVWTTKIIYLGKETIKTKLGTFNCIKVKPLVLKGRVFKEVYPLTIWISDDKNHIPVMAESTVLVGVVKVELMQYKGLKNPFVAKIK